MEMLDQKWMKGMEEELSLMGSILAHHRKTLDGRAHRHRWSCYPDVMLAKVLQLLDETE